jgi:hypothetical protein
MTYTVEQMVFDNRAFGVRNLVREAKAARVAVLSHRQHRDAHPDSHRGCLWCEDGRLAHFLTEIARYESGGSQDANDHTSAIGAVYDALYVPA